MALYLSLDIGKDNPRLTVAFGLSSRQSGLKFLLRGHPFMTSALRGGGELEIWLILQANSTDKLREMQTKGEGV